MKWTNQALLILLCSSVIALLFCFSRPSRSGVVEVMPYAKRDFEALLASRPAELREIVWDEIRGTDLKMVTIRENRDDLNGKRFRHAMDFINQWGVEEHRLKAPPLGFLEHSIWESAIIEHERFSGEYKRFVTRFGLH